MIARIIPPGTFVCAYVIEFDDGGPDEMGVLHEGTEAECWTVRNAIPAINYDGPRRPKSCIVKVIPC